jgi:hypothetical protein
MFEMRWLDTALDVWIRPPHRAVFVAGSENRISKAEVYGNRTQQGISEKTALLAQAGAESGALTPTSPHIDPALTALISAWPTLPEAIRAGILAMVRAAGG